MESGEESTVLNTGDEKGPSRTSWLVIGDQASGPKLILVITEIKLSCDSFVLLPNK